MWTAADIYESKRWSIVVPVGHRAKAHPSREGSVGEHTGVRFNQSEELEARGG
jgi:hypothetical protein